MNAVNVQVHAQKHTHTPTKRGRKRKSPTTPFAFRSTAQARATANALQRKQKKKTKERVKVNRTRRLILFKHTLFSLTASTNTSLQSLRHRRDHQYHLDHHHPLGQLLRLQLQIQVCFFLFLIARPARALVSAMGPLTFAALAANVASAANGLGGWKRVAAWNIFSFIFILSMGILFSSRSPLLSNDSMSMLPPTYYFHAANANAASGFQREEWTTIMKTKVASLASLANKTEPSIARQLASVDVEALVHEIEAKLDRLAHEHVQAQTTHNHLHNTNITTTYQPSHGTYLASPIALAVSLEPVLSRRRAIETVQLPAHFERLMCAYERVLNTSAWVALAPYLTHRLLSNAKNNHSDTLVDLPDAWTGAGWGDASDHDQTRYTRVPRPLFSGTLLEATRRSLISLTHTIRSDLESAAKEYYGAGLSLLETRAEYHRRQTQQQPELVDEDGNWIEQSEEEEEEQERAEGDNPTGFAHTRPTRPSFQRLQDGAAFWANASETVRARLWAAESIAQEHFWTLDRLVNAYTGPSALAGIMELMVPWFPPADAFGNGPLNVGDSGHLQTEQGGNGGTSGTGDEDWQRRDPDHWSAGSTPKRRNTSREQQNTNTTTTAKQRQEHSEPSEPFYPDDHQTDDEEDPIFQRYYQDDPILSSLVAEMNPPSPWASRRDWELWVLRLTLKRNLGESSNDLGSKTIRAADRVAGITDLAAAAKSLSAALPRAQNALADITHRASLWMTGFLVGAINQRRSSLLARWTNKLAFGMHIDDEEKQATLDSESFGGLLPHLEELDRGSAYAGRALDALGIARQAISDAEAVRREFIVLLEDLVEIELMRVEVEVMDIAVVQVPLPPGLKEKQAGESTATTTTMPLATVVLTVSMTQYRLQPARFETLLAEMQQVNGRLLKLAEDVANDWEIIRTNFDYQYAG